MMPIEQTAEYCLIKNIYGNQVAKRSQIPLMHHINEGLQILAWENADLLTMQAYCLHPVFQADTELATYFSTIAYGNLQAQALVLVMEYRNIANQYLSVRQISHISEIALSPLPQVNQMLVADKIQNRKDFELYHQASHPRSHQLSIYFANWLQRLGVSEQKYQSYIALLKPNNLK